MSEQVLAIPVAVLHDVGVFQGFSFQIDHYLPRLLNPVHFRFLPRDDAENDPNFKQIIPYVVLKWQEQLFHYTRGQGGTEKRLCALRSIGVGGHINPIDSEYGDVYRNGMLRELNEELCINSEYVERPIGLINDDSLPVGRVHVGVVHLLELNEPSVERRETGLTGCGFATVSELWAMRDEFETWSQFVLQWIGGN